MERRTFLMAAGASKALGSDNRIRAGLIGAGGRGRYLTEQFKEVGADITAVCDVYEPNLQAGLRAASTGARSLQDYRAMLDDRSIDAVIVATPDHWHARMVIDAVTAGKDVYVEKPLCHEIAEGYEMAAATRSHNRIVQVGTQRRSAPLFLEAQQLARSGVLGESRLVTSHWLNNQTSINRAELKGRLDWKQWLGPAQQRPLDPGVFFNWYYYYDFSGGLLVGQAAHIVDSIQWFMGSAEPVAVTCVGGRINLEGVQIPETATLSIEFPENYLATFTLGYKAMRYHTHIDQLIQFHGSKARLDVGRENWALYPEDPRAMAMKPSRSDDQPGSFNAATRAHIRNFLECVRTRSTPNAPVEGGLATAIVLCMAMESLKQGRRIRWNSAKRSIEA